MKSKPTIPKPAVQERPICRGSGNIVFTKPITFNWMTAEEWTCLDSKFNAEVGETLKVEIYAIGTKMGDETPVSKGLGYAMVIEDHGCIHDDVVAWLPMDSFKLGKYFRENKS